MAGFNGSGTFVRTYNWVTDKGNSVKVTASRMDGEDDGFATGLSNCITKDGQTTTTVVIPFAQGWRTSDGTVGTPSQSWTSDTDSGFYRIGANNVGLALAGVKAWDFGTATSSVAGSMAVGGTLQVTGTITGAVTGNVTGNVTGDVTGNISGASANFTATCSAAALHTTTLVAGGLISGVDASFSATCSAAVIKATGSVLGASASFTATCAAAALVASGVVSGATVGGSMVAAQAGQETGTSTTTVVTPGRQHFHNSAAKVWGLLNVDGTLAAGYNISSVTDNGAGSATVNMTTAFSSAGYSSIVNPIADSVLIGQAASTGYAAGAFTAVSRNAAGTNVDPGTYGVAGFGDFA